MLPSKRCIDLAAKLSTAKLRNGEVETYYGPLRVKKRENKYKFSTAKHRNYTQTLNLLTPDNLMNIGKQLKQDFCTVVSLQHRYSELLNKTRTGKQTQQNRAHTKTQHRNTTQDKTQHM